MNRLKPDKVKKQENPFYYIDRTIKMLGGVNDVTTKQNTQRG